MGVVVGAIFVSGFCGMQSLQAAEKKSPRATAPQNGKVVGIVTAKSDKEIMVKAEGENEAKSYRLAPEGGTSQADLQTALKTVFVPNLVTLEWRGQDQPVVTGIRVVLPNARQGVVAGTVVARNTPPQKEAPWIEVKPNGQGYTQRYWCVWKNGGLDKEVARVIGEVNPGDKVNLGWFYDERARAVQIQIVSRAKPKPAGQDEPAQKEGKPKRAP